MAFQQHQPPQQHTHHTNNTDSNQHQGIAAAAAATNNAQPISRSASHADSYFPQPSPSALPSHQQQQLSQSYNPPQHSSHLPQQSTTDDDATRLNTIANATSPTGGTTTTRGARFTEEWDASQRGGSSIMEGQQGNNTMQRSSSYAGSIGPSESGQHNISLSRGNTLKKKASIVRSGSVKRSGSRRSTRAGSVKSLALQSSNDPDEMHSAFYCPVPTTGNPTEALSNRFQAWRKILKDLITYFREIQNHYEQRGKSLLKLANALNNTAMPAGFLPSGGLDDALQILREHNRHALMESAKAREIEEDVILALTGLRSDLHQKIKEIKNLSGDFKNAVDREMEATRRAVNSLQEVLGQAEMDSALTTGKQDPYLLRLAVDRQLERQIDEENYLHQAYLNLETSGRELESIVVGEIQKSYNAYAGILKRDADAAYGAIEDLRTGPIAMPKDHEWTHFVSKDEQFVDPNIPIRSADYIHYPGRDHYACQEIRAGLLERKSKYLKSYTAGWYVLSPTHLHEFKSADKTQAPIMSLYLPEQKLGSHSNEGHSSNKFILKGRQTGGMHRGHTWVFRAESHDTMMAWYEDIKTLTEKSPEERSNFVRGHVRSLSRSSQHSARSFSSDGNVDEDEDDEPPFAGTSESLQAHQAIQQPQTQPRQDDTARRPEPGGRFPSDLQVNAQRGLQVPVSPSSVSSGSIRHDREQHLQKQAYATNNDNHDDTHQHHEKQKERHDDSHNNNNNYNEQPQPQQRQVHDNDQGHHQMQRHDDNFTNIEQPQPQQRQQVPDNSQGYDNQYQQQSQDFNNNPNEAVRQAAGLAGTTMFIAQQQKNNNNPYAIPTGNDPNRYGSTERTPMGEAPSHAAIVSAQAREDGVNPYTNEPFYEQSDAGYFAGAGSAQQQEDAPATDNVPQRSLSSRAAGSGLMVVGLEDKQHQQQKDTTEAHPDNESQHPGVAQSRSSSYRQDNIPAPVVHQQQQHQESYPIPGNLPETPATTTDIRPFHTEEQVGAGTAADANKIYGTGTTTPYATRPAENTRTETISNLHVPGEYPRSVAGGGLI